MCLSSVYKEKALGDDDMDVIYLNGWVAVYQFLASLLFAVPSAYAMGLPVSVRSKERWCYGGVYDVCRLGVSTGLSTFCFLGGGLSDLKIPAVGWICCLQLACVICSLRMLPITSYITQEYRRTYMRVPSLP